MRVEAILEKGSGVVCEDALLIGDDIFGVFDGATGVPPYSDPEGKSGGAISSALARKIFDEHGENLLGAVRRLNMVLHQAMQDGNIDIRNRVQLWCTTAAVVLLHDGICEWIQVGDSPIILLYRDGSRKEITQPGNHDWESLRLWTELLSQGATDPWSDARMMQQLIDTRQKMNIEYGVINGESDVEPFLIRGQEEISRLKTILMFTDGLQVPTEAPSERHDYTRLIELFQTHGLFGLQKEVRRIEATDHTCRQYPRFKPHDDVAGMALYLE